MFCPQCGNKQAEDLKFCNLCGVNLQAVRQVVAAREAEGGFDWSKTWVAEMFLSESERKKRQAQLERERGVTPEVKRYNEIKAGVIISFVGAAVTIFLFILMEGIIHSGQNPPGVVPILRAVPAAGLIPLMVGLALIFNGLFVSRKLVELSRREGREGRDALGGAAQRPTLRAADTAEFIPPGYSVTEGTTKHLDARAPES